LVLDGGEGRRRARRCPKPRFRVVGRERELRKHRRKSTPLRGTGRRRPALGPAGHPRVESELDRCGRSKPGQELPARIPPKRRNPRRDTLHRRPREPRHRTSRAAAAAAAAAATTTGRTVFGRRGTHLIIFIIIAYGCR
ncbi:unnamed protein product, partial [Ectocarpus sp. 12 AP-2014]